ncbi:MAG: hypothetical protein OCU16_01885 [Candidatus Methanospirare jalkutatii]|nr:hypothetical protein [Candidatus Methanospirare jalkutatii]
MDEMGTSPTDAQVRAGGHKTKNFLIIFQTFLKSRRAFILIFQIFLR